MKVLFLTRYPIEGASSRYRVYQYLPTLRKMGVEADVQSFMDKDLYRLSFETGRTAAKVRGTVRALYRRLKAIASAGSYDIIYLQRELLPFGPPLFERLLKARGTVLMFDYDDALFIKKPSRYNKIATWLRSSEKTFDLFRISDCVVAGNNYLRDVAAEYCSRAVVIEVAEDTDRIQQRPPHVNGDRLVIGWLGSKSTVKYLHLIAPALREIVRRYPSVELEVVGGGEFSMADLQVRNTPWSLDGELEALQRFDIGIMPLPLEEWSKGKSGGKARTYMAAGVPAVCTRIGYNTELIRDTRTGFLCETEEEWVFALSKLVEDPQLREQVGRAAREDVITRFSVAGQAAKLHDLFAQVLSGRTVHHPEGNATLA